MPREWSAQPPPHCSEVILGNSASSGVFAEVILGNSTSSGGFTPVCVHTSLRDSRHVSQEGMSAHNCSGMAELQSRTSVLCARKICATENMTASWKNSAENHARVRWSIGNKSSFHDIRPPPPLPSPFVFSPKYKCARRWQLFFVGKGVNTGSQKI